jgi:signal transduction histidine kinase
MPMPNVPVPYGKLHIFRQWLGLNEAELQKLEPLKDILIRRKGDFAAYFRRFFMDIPEARLIIEHERRPGYLLEAWAGWFETLFSRGLDEGFLNYLWSVGVKHVEIRLDKRFSSMGFSVVRQFCQEAALSELPPEKAAGALMAIDKLVDFCLLVETDAYLEATTRCDTEIIKGIADRIRNPVTIIGGNVNRLLKHVDAADPVYPVYQFISAQSSKCERLVRDIKTYMEVFEREPLFGKISIAELLNEVFEKLFAHDRYTRPRIDIDIKPGAGDILADRRDMEALFSHLLENGIEALEGEDARIRITSGQEGVRPHSLTVTIFNTGSPIKEEEITKLLSPFYSTKPNGTGFGLAIARQAARNNMGWMRLEAVKGEGTQVVLSLPRYE